MGRYYLRHLKNNIKNKLFIGLSFGITIILSLVAFLNALYHLFYTPMGADTLFEVPARASAYYFVKNLSEHHWVRYPKTFLLLIRLEGYQHVLKSGIYKISPHESAQHFLVRVVAGDVLRLPFQITDGETQGQIIQKINHSPYLKNDVSKHNLPGEGMLLADTYFYTAGSGAGHLINQAKLALESELQAIWMQRSESVPYQSPYELLITASILQKESRFADEQSLIAGVILNRLKMHMPLQMDPTVIYAMGDNYLGHLSHNDLKIDSPYNTYRYRGLPPTPIAMVGRNALIAAAHPKQSNYLYFVARGDGRHEFSSNYNDQRRAIQQFMHRGP